MSRPAAVTGRLGFGALTACVPLMLAALAAGSRWPRAGLLSLAAVAAVGLLAEAGSIRVGGRWASTLDRLLLGMPTRFLLRQAVLLAGLCALLPGWRWWQATLVLLGPIAVQAGRLGVGALVLLRQRAYDPVVEWRNLPLPLPAALARRRRRALDTASTVLVADVGLVAGALAGAVLTGHAARLAVVIGALVSVFGAVAALLYVLAGALAARRLRASRPGRHVLAPALAELRPEVVVCFSGPAETSHALTQWLAVLEQISRPLLIVVRESWHLPRLVGARLPVVVLPAAEDLVRYLPASVRVALYPANTGRNDQLIARPGIRHCFIGHGDSDKGASFNPSNRKYDEIWVAGQAGEDRYLRLHEGFRLDQFVRVGRPQLAGIRRADPSLPSDRRPTVGYLPTWEGYFDSHDYSSLATMGEAIVAELLRAGARVLFKPHPSTGLRLPQAREAADAVSALLAATPGGHQTLADNDGDIYSAFNAADILIGDVSSVVSDYLASRKPYLVTNPRGLPHEEFRRRYPAASAAHLVDPDAATVVEAVRESLGPDRWRERREALADYLLGPLVADPVARFVGELDALVTRAGGVRR